MAFVWRASGRWGAAELGQTIGRRPAELIITSGKRGSFCAPARIAPAAPFGPSAGGRRRLRGAKVGRAER